MPLPDWMTTETPDKPKKTTKKLTPAQADSVLSTPVGQRPQSVIDQYTPETIERVYGELTQTPLPTQGNVADLVERSSTSWNSPEQQALLDEQKAERKSAVFLERAKAKADALATEKFAVKRPSDEQLLQEWQHSPAATGMALNVQAPPASDLRERWERALPKGESEEQQSWEKELVQRMVDRRDRRLLLDSSRPKDAKPGQRGVNVHRITWDEFNEMGEREQAAVQFNSALVQAARKDKRLFRAGRYDKVTDEERAAYDDAVTGAFGEGRGSKIYAPETMALINQLGTPDPASDLDDYLKLRVAITDDQLDYLDKKLKSIPKLAGQPAVPDLPGMPEGGAPRTEFATTTEDEEARLQLAQALVTDTLNLESRLEESGEMVQSFLASTRLDRNAFVGTFGGLQNEVALKLGFRPLGEGDIGPDGRPANDNAFIQYAYDQLKDPKQDVNTIIAAIKQSNPELIKPLYHYVDQMTKQTLRSGKVVDTNVRDPEKLRQRLGLDR